MCSGPLMPRPRIGCHLSLGRRPRLSIQEASIAGTDCLQIFASNPSAWKPPEPRPEFENEIDQALDEFDQHPLVIHAIYLINLASENPVFLHNSMASLTATLEAGRRMGAAAVITHIGSHGGRGFATVAHTVAESLVSVLNATPDGIDLALENSAGAGGILGSTLEELGVLLAEAGHPPRLKVTLDTAHLTGAGWDFRIPGEAARLVDSIETHVGLERLTVIHANDSKVPPGSRRDRHAAVGEGAIGEAGFAALLARPELVSVPWVLETPDLDSSLPPDEYLCSLRTLRALAEAVGSDGGQPAARAPSVTPPALSGEMPELEP
jgi:deoxyribonuclease-4